MKQDNKAYKQKLRLFKKGIEPNNLTIKKRSNQIDDRQENKQKGS